MVAKQTTQELSPQEAHRKAKELCFNLLAARARSREELRQALRRKGFEEDTRETLLDKLDHAGLVDDAAFADTWVRSRHTHQGLSKQALTDELRRKGVGSSIVEQAVGSIDGDSEELRARELVRKRLRTMTNLDERTKVRRLLGALGRKGYPHAVAYTAVRDELVSTGVPAAELDTLAAPE